MPWHDSPVKKPFDLESLLHLLQQGEKGSLSSHSHWQIVQWCADYVEQAGPRLNSIEQKIADDVVVHWELYLAEQYTIEDMQKFSQSDVLLPKEYFHNWIEQLTQS